MIGGFAEDTSGDADVERDSLEAQFRQLFERIRAASSQPVHVGWIGGRSHTLAAFDRVRRDLQFEGRVLVSEWAARLIRGANVSDMTVATWADLSTQADVLFFDFGPLGDSALSGGDARLDRALDTLVRRDFAAFVSAEHQHERRQPRKYVCLDPPHDLDDRLVLEPLAGPADAALRVVQGFIGQPGGSPTVGDVSPPGAILSGNLIGTMSIGESGERVKAGVLARFGRRGVVLHGPHRVVPAGRYRVDVTLRAHSPLSITAMLRPVILEVAAGAERLAIARAVFCLRGAISAEFSVVPQLGRPQNVYVRVLRGRWVDFVVTSVRFTPLASHVDQRP